MAHQRKKGTRGSGGFPALLWYHSHGAHRLYSGTLDESYLTSDLAFRDSARVDMNSEIDLDWIGWDRWREHDVLRV